MDALILVIFTVLAVALHLVAFKTRGGLFALMGMIVTLYPTGSLMANQSINVGSISGTCSTFGPNCGYVLAAADVQLVILAFALGTIGGAVLLMTLLGE